MPQNIFGSTNVFEGTTPVDTARNQIEHYLNGRGQAVLTKSQTQAIASFESDANAMDIIGTSVESAEVELRAAMQHMGGSVVISQEGDVPGIADETTALTPQQVKAGLITMLAAGDPAAYARRALSVDYSAESGVEMVHIDNNPQMDYHNIVPSAEAFDNQELSNQLAFSVIFNTQAARQDEFGEAFFPTIVLTPDQNSLKVVLRRTMVGRPYRHDQSGKALDFDRRNLVDAAWDYTVTADDTVDIVPYWRDLADVKENFSTAVAPVAVKANGTMIETAPLVFDRQIGLLGLSQNPAVAASGQLDHTDSIDVKVNLKNLYFTLPTATPGEVDVIRFNTASLDYTQFHKTEEHLDRDAQLTFISTDFALSGATRNVADELVVALDPLRAQPRTNYVVRVNISVTGMVNFEKGFTKLQRSQPYVESVWDVLPSGERVEVTDAAEIAAVKLALSGLTLDSYELSARRTNINRRQMGLIISSVAESVRYTVPIGSPITLQTPVTDTPTNSDLMGPIAAARYRNSANAVTKLLETADQLRSLESLLKGANRKGPRPAIQGFGRVMIQPYFHSETIDLLDEAQGIRSYDRWDDICATLVNSIQDRAYRAYRESGYEPNLKAVGGANVTRPKLVLGTDPVIARFLMIKGDPRTGSISFETDIVSTWDDRVRDTIYAAFVRPTSGQVDPLSFGVFAYIPELATSMPISRGSTTKETTVQNRTLHLVLCPILLEFKIKNLREAIAGQISLPTRYKG